MWLIFVLVVLWTAFPPVFAAIASTLYIPLTLAAIGIIARGAAIAFRKFVAVRVTAALAVAAVVWGWAAGQNPWMLQGELTIEQAAASRAVLQAVLGSLAVGTLLFLPR